MDKFNGSFSNFPSLRTPTPVDSWADFVTEESPPFPDETQPKTRRIRNPAIPIVSSTTPEAKEARFLALFEQLDLSNPSHTRPSWPFRGQVALETNEPLETDVIPTSESPEQFTIEYTDDQLLVELYRQAEPCKDETGAVFPIVDENFPPPSYVNLPSPPPSISPERPLDYSRETKRVNSTFRRREASHSEWHCPHLPLHTALSEQTREISNAAFDVFDPPKHLTIPSEEIRIDEQWYEDREAGWDVVGSERKQVATDKSGVWWRHNVLRKHIATGEVRFHDRLEFLPWATDLPSTSK